MTKTLFLLIATLAFSLPAHAEGPGKEQHLQRMVERLQLDEGQAEDFEKIMREQHGKHRAVMEEIHKQAKPKMEAIHQETLQRLAPVLSDAQLQEFEKISQQRRDKMKRRFEQRRGTEQPD